MKIPTRLTITETAPGHLHVDPGELQQYNDEMTLFKKQFDTVIANCDTTDPDAIISSLMQSFLK